MVSDKEIIYLERAKNELNLAETIFKISTTKELKLELGLKEDISFFSNVIGSCYFCIFYSAKALLEFKSIKTKQPNEHNKTLKEFEKLVESGEIDRKLLEIYHNLVIKADELLGIFVIEKNKRGKYTYRRLPQSNLEPAKKSIRNAGIFLKNVNLLIKNE